MRTKESAARAEIGHVRYLLSQIPWLERRSLLPSDFGTKIRAEYERRIAALERIVTSSPAAQSRAPAIPPPLPADRPQNPDSREGVSSPPLDYDLPVAHAETLSPPAAAVNGGDEPSQEGSKRSDRPALRIEPERSAPAVSAGGRPPASEPASEEFRTFFLAHGLKLVFALATMLVIFALRNIIQWHAVGDLFLRSVPLLLIGLTFMFAAFGSRTRAENPWAAFAFHSIACIFIAFDFGSINRFWLEPAHLGIPLKPAAFLATAAATGVAAYLLHRMRAISYLHLVQGGTLVTLFTLLQNLRLAFWHRNDFRAAPLPLFGAAYLALAAINFYVAGAAGRLAEVRRDLPPTRNDPLPEETSSVVDPNQPLVPPSPGELPAGPEQWQAAWTLWANLSASSIVVLSALNALLTDTVRPQDFTAVLLLAGIVYAGAAQALAQRRAAYVSGGLFVGASLLWIAESPAAPWRHFSSLIMCISAGALALSVYGKRRNDENSAELAQAWDRVARHTLFLAATVTALQVVIPWANNSAGHQPPGDSAIRALQSVVSGLLLLTLGRLDARSEYTFAAAAMWATGVAAALEAVNAAPGAYAAAFVAYGSGLYFTALLLRRNRPVTPIDRLSRTERGAPAEGSTERIDEKVGATGPLSSQDLRPGTDAKRKGDPLPARAALARSGMIAATCGVLGAAALPTAGLSTNWFWAGVALAIGSALYILSAREEQSRPAIYAGLACLAYTTALIMWRIDSSLSLADLIAPFAVATGVTSLALAPRGAPPAPTPEQRPDERAPSTDFRGFGPWTVPLAVSSLAVVAIGLLSLCRVVLSTDNSQHPAISALPLLAAAVLTMIARRSPGADGIRTTAALLANLAGALLGSLVSGLSGGPAHWSFPAVERLSAVWLFQAWVVWLCGVVLANLRTPLVWGRELTRCGLILTTAAALVAALGTAEWNAPSTPPLISILAGCFVLTIAEAIVFRSAWARGLSIAVLAMAAAVHGTASKIGSVAPETSWALIALLATVSYFILASRERSLRGAYLTLAPLVVGFLLFSVSKSATLLRYSGSQAALADISVANHLWIAGGLGAAWLYLRIARLFQRAEFAYLAASVFTAAFCHGVLYLARPRPDPEWFALILTPWLLGLFGFGVLRSRKEPYVGEPFRTVSLAAMACACGLISVRAASGASMVTSVSFWVTIGIIVAGFSMSNGETYARSSGLRSSVDAGIGPNRDSIAGSNVARAVSLAVFGMGAVCAHHHASPSTPYPATGWILFALCAAASYFGFARREERPALATLAVWPLSIGYLLFANWRADAALRPTDLALANALVLLGGFGASAAYSAIDLRSKDRSFGYLAAILAVGTYAHGVSLFAPASPEMFATAMLPLLIVMAAAGVLLRREHETLGEPFREVGIAVALLGSITVAVHAGSHTPSGAVFGPSVLVALTAFVMAGIENYLRRTTSSQVISLVALGLIGLTFQAYSGSEPAWLATMWTACMLVAVAAYFAASWRDENRRAVYLPMIPLVTGYAIYQSWRVGGLLSPLDNHIADGIWVAGVAGAAIGYIAAARRFQAVPLAYLSAALLVASYTHGLSILDPNERHIERYALLVLPLLTCMYGYGVYRNEDEYVGRPFRRVALALSAAATLFSTVFGDHLISNSGTAVDHSFISWTLAAYGIAYSLIAAYRKTPGTVATGSVMMTIAFLHCLLTLTPEWSAPARLSWGQFAACVALAGIVWIATAWYLGRRSGLPAHARPLHAVAGALALLAATVVWMERASRGEADWSLPALAGASVIWLALWKREKSEVCWHVGAWNLLAVWIIAIRWRLGPVPDRSDLYLIPFGIYLLMTGHRVARENALVARVAWPLGLILPMGSCFVLYWTRSPGWHHILVLIAECVLATLWGVLRRIRAYVSVGFAFLVLLTVASWFRHVNDVASTVSALFTGVTLFVCVYYWLTHREKIEGWLLRASGEWRAWR